MILLSEMIILLDFLQLSYYSNSKWSRLKKMEGEGGGDIDQNLDYLEKEFLFMKNSYFLWRNLLDFSSGPVQGAYYIAFDAMGP